MPPQEEDDGIYRGWPFNIDYTLPDFPRDSNGRLCPLPGSERPRQPWPFGGEEDYVMRFDYSQGGSLPIKTVEARGVPLPGPAPYSQEQLDAALKEWPYDPDWKAKAAEREARKPPPPRWHFRPNRNQRKKLDRQGQVWDDDTDEDYELPGTSSATDSEFEESSDEIDRKERAAKRRVAKMRASGAIKAGKAPAKPKPDSKAEPAAKAKPAPKTQPVAKRSGPKSPVGAPKKPRSRK